MYKYKNSISSLRFENYITKKLNFRLNELYKMDNELELALKFNHELQLDYEEKKAILVLDCILFEDSIENNYPFELEISLLGFFKFDTDLNEGEIINLLEVNGTAILFPYLRSIITTTTSTLGITPIIIPTMNIYRMLKEKED